MAESQADSPVPELPCLRMKDLPWFQTEDPRSGDKLQRGVMKALKSSSGIIFNGIEDLETDQLVLRTLTRQEFDKLEGIKSGIDKRAKNLVRKELWAVLGLFMAQIIIIFRLTYWDLSWDVMEPICFFATSICVLAGCAFFLITSKAPSFEGLYEYRFETKQKQLIKLLGFDFERFTKLQKMLDEAGNVGNLLNLIPTQEDAATRQDIDLVRIDIDLLTKATTIEQGHVCEQ